MEYRVCSGCKISKSLSDFPFSNKEKNKRRYYCSVCSSKMGSDWYKRNKKKVIDRANLQKEIIKQEIYKIKESVPCADCGIFYPHYVMDFDHLFDKKFNISTNIKRKGRRQLLAEIAKCEVVCSNCHRIRTYKKY